MKGLLIKDFYLMMKTCRMYFLMILIFFVLAVVIPERSAIYLYDAIFMGMLSHTLLSLEDRDGSDKYYLICPYSRKQIVIEKYILSAILIAVISAVIAVLELIKKTDISEIMLILSLVAAVGIIFPSISMPIMFKYGYAKGKIVFICLGALIGICGAFFVNTTSFFSGALAQSINGFLPLILIVGSVLIFVLSCLISVRLFKKREF